MSTGFIVSVILLCSTLSMMVCLIVKDCLHRKEIEKIGKWVYNVAPRYIIEVEGGYYKFTADFLDKYKEFTKDERFLLD